MGKYNTNDYSKKRLGGIINKNFNTSIIGALDVFEKFFGELWGHNSDKLTDEQKEWLDTWEEARQELLDKGHSQRRATLDELEHYSVGWNRYQLTFIPKDSNYNRRNKND